RLRRQANHPWSLEDNARAGVGGDEAGEKVVDSRLAGAVRAEDADDLAALDRERDVLDGMKTAEVLVEVRDLEQRRHVEGSRETGTAAAGRLAVSAARILR